MRVLMTSTSYPRDETDWRGIFIRHMAGAIGTLSDTQLALWAPPGTLPPDVASAATATESAWLNRLMQDGGISHLLRRHPIVGLARSAKLLTMLRAAYKRSRTIDLYHVNWLQSAIPLPNDGKPALITVLGNDLKLLGLPQVKRLLRRTMRSRPVTLCPNAEWMQSPLNEAFGDVAKVTPVVFGIDQRWYNIRRIPSCPPRWLAVTRLTRDKIGSLFDWSAELFSHGERELHLFGPMQEQIDLPSWIHYHGSAEPAALARDWFPNATGLISLSRHAEGRPQVMLEAMASGLPIVASDMPAHASFITHDQTGMLCGSELEYKENIRHLERDSANCNIGEQARQWALGNVGTWEDCALRYHRIYRDLLGASND